MNPGDQLGHYTIVSTLGSGGMGRPSSDRHGPGPRRGAQILPPEMAADPDRLRRFRREARAVAALNHPHIVTIYSVEQVSGVHFLTMELVSGQALDRMMMTGRALPVERVVAVAQAVASALAAAHEKGIVHRDLKPANVIASDSGPVKVLDFGLAKIQQVTSTPDAAATGLATEVGMVLGTPAYMSPEQVSASPLTIARTFFARRAALRAGDGRAAVHGRSSGAGLVDSARLARAVSEIVAILRTWRR